MYVSTLKFSLKFTKTSLQGCTTMELTHGYYEPGGSAETNTLETQIKPRSLEYRKSSIEEGFDWSKIMEILAAKQDLTNAQLYLVVFRSTRKSDTDEATELGETLEERIARLDAAAHAEAAQSDTLLHYFAGDVDEDTGRAMSWCLWTDMAGARSAISGPAHRDAFRQVGELYEDFDLETHTISVDGQNAIIFAPYVRE